MLIRSELLLLVAAAILLAATTVVKFEPITTQVQEQPEKPKAHVRKDGENTIVVIFAGQKPTGGYSVEVTKAEKTGKVCIVSYRIHAPARNAMVTQVITHPYQAVRLYANCGTVQFDPPTPMGDSR